MGNCCGTEDDEYHNDDDINERSRLLGGSSGRRRATSTSESTDGVTGKLPSPLQKTDEHRALSDILDQTVRNIIDVSQLENTSEQHNDIEKATRYSEELAKISNVTEESALTKIKDNPNADKTLNAPHLSAAEYNFMMESSAACYTALQNITVTPRDDLLVTFVVSTQC